MRGRSSTRTEKRSWKDFGRGLVHGFIVFVPAALIVEYLEPHLEQIPYELVTVAAFLVSLFMISLALSIFRGEKDR